MTEQRLQTGAEHPRTLIVGMGLTGLSCVRYLQAHNVPVVIIDSRSHPPGLAALREQMFGASVVTGGFDPRVFASAERIIVSPGVSIQEPQIRAAHERGAEVIGDIELFAREVKAPVAAITGSNGKSTVTTLLGEMARCAGREVAVGGNIGLPALDLLADRVELYLLELSSFQLETTRSLNPRVAAVLNISADHLDRYGGVEAYAQTKSAIYNGAQIRLFNLDDPMVMAMRGQPQADDLFFTLQSVDSPDQFGVNLQSGEPWLCRGRQALLPVSELQLPGRHSQANALAALALGAALELPMPAMLEALRNFCGLPHRTQFVAEHAGVRWYNDSKATNVGACIAALEGMANDVGCIVLIAGGEGKGADFSELAAVVERTVRAVVLIGRDAAEIEDALMGVVPTARAADMDVAVARAGELARPGDLVLLSPACASFDMFQNFGQRGVAFSDAVRRLQT